MKKSLFICFILLGFSVFAQNKTENIELIKNFYSNYMKENFLQEKMDKTLSGKLDRMRAMIGADPIISAQDVIPEMEKTLQVAHIKGDWYRTSYEVTIDSKKEKTNIFVKVQNAKIVAVYPWEIDIDAMDKPFQPKKISHKNPHTFVETFYQNYLACYLNHSQNPNQCLEPLRNTYCSPNALKQIQQLKENYLEDGQEGFDPLIDNFDFDKSFLKALTINQIHHDTISIKYTSVFGNHVKINIRVKKNKNEFLIDDISI